MAETLPMLLASRALVGAAAGCFIPAARAIAASIDPTRSGENLGRLARVDLAGFATGPIIGSLLFEVVGLRGTFIFFAVVAAAALVLLAPRPLPSLPTSAESSRPSLVLLRHRRVLVATLLALALFLPVGVFDSLWDRYLTDLGGSNLLVGLTFALFALPFVTLTAPAGRLADRLGHVRISLWGLAVLVPCLALYGVFKLHPRARAAADGRGGGPGGHRARLPGRDGRGLPAGPGRGRARVSPPRPSWRAPRSPRSWPRRSTRTWARGSCSPGRRPSSPPWPSRHGR